MKRILSLFLVLLLLLCGCNNGTASTENTFTFYYLEHEYQYGQAASMVAPEHRESASQRKDLMYMMNLYMMGPAEEAHIMPLPAETRINCHEMEDGSIKLELSGAARLLSDSEFSLACTCLSLTCFNITESPEVTVVNGDRSITINRNNYLLKDDITSYSATEETK